MNNNDCKEMLALIVGFFIFLIYCECAAVYSYGTLSAFFAKETENVVAVGTFLLAIFGPAVGGAIVAIVEAVIGEYKNREGIFGKLGDNNMERIKKIAKASRGIVAEADAQNIVTEDEVERLVLDLLTDKQSLASIKQDAKAKAEELCSKKIAKAPALEQLVDYGADYGPLCLALDGYSTVKEAVRQGLVDNWAHVIEMQSKDSNHD